MDAVIKEYGEYIVAVIACSIVIFGVSLVMGLFESSSAAINAGYENISGNGPFGKCICLWLNRIM